MEHVSSLAGNPSTPLSAGSIDRAIQQEAGMIVAEDADRRQIATVAQSTQQLPDVEGGAHNDDEGGSPSCCTLCCAPIFLKCSCKRKSRGNLWRRCFAASGHFCAKRCLCRCTAGDETDGTMNLHHNFWRSALVCCCYVDTTERPVYTTRRRGLVPLSLVVLGHILFGLVFMIIMTGIFLAEGWKTIWRRVN